MKRLPEVLAVGALAAVLAIAVTAQSDPASRDAAAAQAQATNDLALRDVRVFDGMRVLPRTDVLVRDGRIVAVGRGLDLPGDIEIIDGAGKTLLPGLIDAHTHSWGEARREALRFGVTAELDMLGDWTRLPELKRERESLQRTDQADLWSAGAAVTAPGGHGTQYGMNVPTLAADGDAAAFAIARIDEGSDYLKLILEDFSAHSESRRLPTITAAQAGAAITAAHARDKLGVVHVSRLRDGKAAIAAGADGLVHVFGEPGDAEFVAAAEKRRLFVIPTLSVLATIARADEGRALGEDARLRPWLSPSQRDSLQASFGNAAARPAVLNDAIANVRALHAAGVDILAGTDAGNPGTAHGASMHGELELLVRAGLSPAQALAAATSTPARRFGLKDRGRIAPGMRADLLLVEGDPTREITDSRRIIGVWKNGHAVSRAPAKSADVAAALPQQPLISDFDDGEVRAKFGSWQPTTDQIAGGASVAAHRWVEGGAEGSRGALEISGSIRAGFAFPWAGMMFFPNETPMMPVDATSRRELVFQARGDGRRYTAMLFSGASTQGMPSMQTFAADAQWREVRLPLSGFAGADLANLRGIAITAGQPEGDFVVRIDQVELR
ncbi:MAG: amidohydrolase [Lysobacteraceae bacterium]|nr:MAG: amidohydrolase [Xanthomonadaceae bacterium]